MLGELKLPKEQENYARDVRVCAFPSKSDVALSRHAQESLHSLASFISDSLLLVRADSRQVKLERTVPRIRQRLLTSPLRRRTF